MLLSDYVYSNWRDSIEELQLWTVQVNINEMTLFHKPFVEIASKLAESRKHVRPLRRLAEEWRVTIAADDVTEQTTSSKISYKIPSALR